VGTEDDDPPVPMDQYGLCLVKTPLGVGSGFAFLRPNWIVTAKHVVVRDGTAATPIELLYAPAFKSSARLLLAHPYVDLAVLEVTGECRCRAALMPVDRSLPNGRGFLCVGHRPSLSHPSLGHYVSFVSGVAEAQTSRTPLPNGDEEVVLTFAAPNGEPGHSGGPLIGDAGGVVAVVFEGITLLGEHYMRATSILALLDHLAFRSDP
jgi:S1-C subfamily serine protease